MTATTTAPNRARAAAGLSKSSPPPVQPFQTRRPTGKPSWPIVLLAGAEKAGKSYNAAFASTSAHVDRTFWISCAEPDPDEYGAIPGADFEIVPHDGTYRSTLEAIRWAVAQPAGDGKVNLIVLDSAGRAWALLSDMAQYEMDARIMAKAAKYNRTAPHPDDISRIDQDLWNTANQRWNHIMTELRKHRGPVILTARLELQTVMVDGAPTKDKWWKVVAQKGLPFDCEVVVQLPTFGEVYVSSVKSLKYHPDPSVNVYDAFTVEQLWRNMGVLDAGATAARNQTEADPSDGAEAAKAALASLRKLATDSGWELTDVVKEWAAQTDGGDLRSCTNAAAINRFAEELAVAWAFEAQDPAAIEPPASE